MTYAASVIISFYNKIDWLELVLAGLQRQTSKNFEVIIADDGSRDEVVNRIKQIQQTSPLAIQHLWHPDKGFMKTTMLNKAVMASLSENLIFLDGDCIPHKNFVADHVRLLRPDRVLAGRRVNLSDEISKSLTVSSILNGHLENLFIVKLFTASLTQNLKDAEKGIHIGNSSINESFGSYNKGLLGCNFSVTKKAVLDVNGFDERYQYPGVGEDSEIEFRLIKNGVKIFSPKFCIVQYHLWHPKLSREKKPDNMKLFIESQEKGYTYTPYGINQQAGN